MQLARDEAKLWTWPVYATQTRMRNRCPAVVLVVSPEPSVRRWATSVIDRIERELRGVVSVLDPKRLPATDARQNLELAVLAVLAGGGDDAGPDTVLATVDALLGSQDEYAEI